MLKIKMSPLSDVLSRLSDEINMQEDLSHELCPHNRSSRLSESPLSGDYCITIISESATWRLAFQ